MAQHADPTWRRGTGTAKPITTLSQEAETALQAWNGILAVRHDPTKATRLHRDEIDRIVREEYDTTLGRLLAVAVEDADTRTLRSQVDMMADLVDEWTMVQTLADLDRALNPPVVLTEQESTCSHGVPFASDCAECDAEF